jgi:hypothetical protein
MSESKTKEIDDEQVSEEKVRELFENWDIPYNDLNYAVNNDPEDIPYVVFAHDAYAGCEAHFFTIADIALWIPEMLPSGDVVLYYPLRQLDDKHPDALLRRRTLSWEFLTYNFDDLMHKLWVKAKREYVSTDQWAHYEKEWQVALIEVPENMPIRIDKILRRVDKSIRGPVLELNKAGFATIESCSGLTKDHEEIRPFEAYVCFDCESYHDVSAHLFTLAELAEWDPCWGAHGFDVLLYASVEGERELEKAWKRLGNIAKELGEDLAAYRDLVEPYQGYYYYRFRRERGLFSRYYSEESRTLSGFIDELKKIDEEYNKEGDEED